MSRCASLTTRSGCRIRPPDGRAIDARPDSVSGRASGGRSGDRRARPEGRQGRDRWRRCRSSRRAPPPCTGPCGMPPRTSAQPGTAAAARSSRDASLPWLVTVGRPGPRTGTPGRRDSNEADRRCPGRPGNWSSGRTPRRVPPRSSRAARARTIRRRRPPTAPRAGYRATAADSGGAGPRPEKAGRMMTHRHEPVMA